MYAEKTTEISKLLKTSSPGINILWIGVCVILIVWILQFHWKRRKMYQIARQVNVGPPCWPVVGSALKFIGNASQVFDTIVKCFDLYPNLSKVWFGSRLYYFVTKPEYLEIVLNNPNSLGKMKLLYKYIAGVFGNGLITASIPIWRRHKKIIMPALNQKILDDYVEVFQEKSLILTHELAEVSNKEPINIFKHVNKCTLDMISETAMGVPISVQDEKFLFTKWINRASKIVFMRFVRIWYHSDHIFRMTSLYREQTELISNIDNFINQIILEKKRKRANCREQSNGIEYCDEGKFRRKDFLELLIEMSELGANFSDEELKDETLTFMIAASDTTATTTCFALLMIAMHPDVQEKVYLEVLNTLGSNREIDFKDLAQFKYTERVIKETLRLFPAAPIVMRDIENDLSLGDVTLAGNSSALLGIFHIHRSAEYWPNPLTFDPNRFLPEEVAKRHPYCYLPFSGGPRKCAGARYACMAMKVIIATVIQKYRISTPFKRVEDIELKTNLALRPQMGFMLTYETRNR